MSGQDGTVAVTIDNKACVVESGSTILQAARHNDIYIPTLCFHKELSPHGGCRMCIVEVEGMRNFPTACTTPVTDGMIVRTHTAQIQAMRVDILQLFLSEHPASCLVCEENEECKKFNLTIRKAGFTTGCRYCPKDGQCELQTVTEKLGVTSMDYPIYYRSLRVENEDPFYDRDYNLCILCGRCIRMCQEIRTANVLAFKQRGRSTVIGPAYERTHLEAGCEFCGACVSVCPVGALREKARAWEGKPDREETTTCSFCGVGCQVQLLVRGDRVIGCLPAPDPVVNEGQLCVKGRFCNTELVNCHLRLHTPYRTDTGASADISWEKAVELAAEKLSACSPIEFGMLISPNCTNEDLYVAQKFVRTAIGSHNIDTSARLFYGAGFDAYLDLLQLSAPLSSLREASVILCVGLDTRFARSVVGVALRRANKRGAKIISINPRYHSLSLLADRWLRPMPGQVARLIRSLAAKVEERVGRASGAPQAVAAGLSDELSAVAELLRDATAPVILVGSEFLQHDESVEIMQAVKTLAESVGAGVMPLPAQNNLVGSVLMGAYPELLPGARSASDAEALADLAKSWGTDIPRFQHNWDANELASGKKMKVLYLVGELLPDGAARPDFVIFQNICPPEEISDSDLVLPAAASTEVDGTFVNGEGRIQRVRKAVAPPGGALADWEIICRIAGKMGKSGFDFASASDVHEEIASLISGFKTLDDVSREASPVTVAFSLVPATAGRGQAVREVDAEFPLLLTLSAAEHTHRGFPLSTWVEGSKMLLTEGVLEISPEDGRDSGISSGDEVIVTSARSEWVWPARIMDKQQQGFLHATLSKAALICSNPQPVKIRKKDV